MVDSLKISAKTRGPTGDATAIIIPYRGIASTGTRRCPAALRHGTPHATLSPCSRANVQSHMPPDETSNQAQWKTPRAPWRSIAGRSSSQSMVAPAFGLAPHVDPSLLCLPSAPTTRPPRPTPFHPTLAVHNAPLCLEYSIFMIARVTRLHVHYWPCLIPGCSASAKAS